MVVGFVWYWMENGVPSFWTLSTSSADRSFTVNVSPVAAVLRGGVSGRRGLPRTAPPIPR